MQNLVKTFAILAVTGQMSACASIVSDSNSGTYIETDPEKARCELHGQDFTRVVETPNSILLPAAAAPITIACRAEGYKNTTAILDTKMDGWILGNILFGGIIGIAVDAAKGSGQKYPPRFALVLEPEGFSSLTQRDLFYDNRRRVAEEKWAKIILDIQNQCNSGNENEKSSCSQRQEQVQSEKDKELADIEKKRTQAVIRG